MSVNWSYKSYSRHFYIQIFGNLWLVPCYSPDSKLSNTKKQVLITFSPLKLRVWILDKYELKLKNHRPMNYPTKLQTFVFWIYLLSDDDFDKIRGRIHQTAQQILAWFKVWKVVFGSVKLKCEFGVINLFFSFNPYLYPIFRHCVRKANNCLFLVS